MTKSVLELRVHGIGSHQPYEVLGAPIREEGDREVGMFKLPDNLRPNVHAFVWSRVTRRRFGGYRYLLLPFTLVNVAGFMHGAQRGRRGIGDWVFRCFVNVMGASVTVSYVYWLWALTADLPHAYGASETAQVVAFYAVLALVLGPVVVGLLWRRRAYPDDTVGAGVRSPVAHASFWRTRMPRRQYLLHLFLVGVIAESLNLATDWDDDVLIALARGQLIALFSLGLLIGIRAVRDNRGSEVGAVFSVGAAIALPHCVFGSVLLAVAWVIERWESVVVREEIRFLVLRPRPEWQWIATFFFLTLGLWAWLQHHRVTTIDAEQPARIKQVRSAYSITTGDTPKWARVIAFKRQRPLVQGAPQSLLLHRPQFFVGVCACIGAAGWFGIFERRDSVAASFFRGSAADLWGWITIGLAALVSVGLVLFFRSDDAETRAAVVFDVLGFWPRQHHPLAPPPYATKVVEQLRDVLVERANAREDVVLIGHSQGSVLAYVALLRTAPTAYNYVTLVTCGSPLASLYAASFPAYFSSEDFRDLRDRLRSASGDRTLGWLNLFRDTDPIGTAIFPADAAASDIEILEPEPIQRLQGHSGYWEDHAMLQLLATLADQRVNSEAAPEAPL